MNFIKVTLGRLYKLLLAMSGPYKIRAREKPERNISNY